MKAGIAKVMGAVLALAVVRAYGQPYRAYGQHGHVVTVKEEPDIGQPTVTVLHTGERVEGTGRSKNDGDDIWFEIETTGGDSGWVNSRYLIPERSSYRVHVPGGSIGLRVRTGPDAAERVRTVLYPGEHVEGTGAWRRGRRDVIWFEIETTGGDSGWVNSHYLIPQNRSLYLVYVSPRDRLAVREGPGANYDIVERLDADGDVSATGRWRDNQGDLWLEIVTSEGHVGWVNGHYLVPQPSLVGEKVKAEAKS